MPESESKQEKKYPLHRDFRIRQNRDYRRIYSAGRRFSNRAGLMYVVRTKREPVRIGFVTTKRIGNAVARNRARRLMKEVYRLHRHELSSHYEAILLAAAFLTTATYSEAEKALLALWRKAEICFSSETAMLPFHSHLQHLRAGSGGEIWRAERRMARVKTDLEVPSFP